MSELQDWYASGRDRVIPRDPRDPPVPPPDWITAAFRVARDGGDGLARLLRVVPSQHLLHRHDATTVACLCGADVVLPDREFVECPGDCSRFFVRDGETVWAARLPAQA